MDVFEITDKIRGSIISGKGFLFALHWPKIFSMARVLSVLISILLLAGIIYILFILKIVDKVKRLFGLIVLPKTLPKKKFAKKWAKIEKRLKTGNEAELKVAVIEADKFFDDLLKRIGILGSDMGGRLKKINSSQISNINDIWDAHKVRNNIVHDTDYKLTSVEAQKSVEVYKKALEELEAL